MLSMLPKFARSSSSEEKDERRAITDAQSIASDDQKDLARMGYRSEFAREFTNLSTISFAFSIMGVSSSIATTFNTPMLLGGPASVVWCWFIGAFMCFTLGTSIAEIVSAYPTNGGLYSASAYLVPKPYKAIVGWVVGWLNLLGQVAGVASTEFGLAGMILSAVTIATNGDFVATQGQTVGVFIGLLFIHGCINSLGTRILSLITKSFIFVNLGSVFAIIVALLVTTSDKHDATYVFTNVNNQSGWGSDGIAFLLGLLSVQWTMTDYDATAHICEEVKRASIAAPVAIFVAVIGTGCIGWIYNIVLVLCSGDIANLPGAGGYSVATILVNNVGLPLFLVLWSFVCFTAFAVVTTALQANARTFHAFSRDRGLPDRGLFSRLSGNKVPVYSVWLVCFLSAILGLLDLASVVAVNAVFALCAVALDTSYIIPIFCKLLFRNHPDVMFVPGPFTLGEGWLGYLINGCAIGWTCFVVLILSLPEVIPVTAENMNYAAPITAGVMLMSLVWYMVPGGGKVHYTGPRNIIQEELNAIQNNTYEEDEDKAEKSSV